MLSYSAFSVASSLPLSSSSSWPAFWSASIRAPNLLELAFHQARRNREISLLRQPVQQIPLDPHAAQLVILALHLAHDRRPQIIQRVEAHLLRQRIVDRRNMTQLQRLHDDLELRSFAGEGLAAVILREGDVDRAGLARRHALELLGKAGNEVRPRHLDVHIRARAADKRLAIDAACVIDRQRLALGSRARLLHRLQPLLAAGDVGQRLVHRLGRRFRLEPGQRQPGEVGWRHLRQQLNLDGELQILRLGRRRHARDVDLGLGRRTHAALGQQLLRRLVDAVFQHLRHHRIAVGAGAARDPAPCRGGSPAA